MRQTRWWCSTVLLLSWAARVWAEPFPYDTVVTVPQAEVRSGPSTDPKFYPTGKLRQGDRVQVLREEEGGWLAIKPPTGSFSWINTRFIELSSQQNTAQVLGDDVIVRVGSELVNGEPTIESKARLKRGAQVIVLDIKKVYNSDGGWLPIAPIPEEVRYIQASSVKPQAQVQTVQSPPAGADAAPMPVGAPVNDPLWQQAQQAEQAGKAADAADLYLQLARRTTDHDVQMRCYNRIHFLRSGMQGSVPPGYQPGQPNVAQYPAQPAVRPYQPVPQGQVTSQYVFQKDAPRAPMPGPVAQGSGPGRLRRAAFFLDNKATYVLESSQGLPIMYVTALPGVSLEPYLNRNVDLWGTVVYRGDVKTNYMTVQQIRPLP